MIKDEKILLLNKIMVDIRGDWGSYLTERVEVAANLAEELKFEKTVKLLNEYKEELADDDGDNDGRFIRCNFENHGGYVGMNKLHELPPNTIIDKSDEFKIAIKLLSNPELAFFEDWETWDKSERKELGMYWVD